MTKTLPRFAQSFACLLLCLTGAGNCAAQIDFTPGLNYTWHRGRTIHNAAGTSYNFSHQFQAQFGFRKHWSHARYVYCNPYFGYMDVQQYFYSASTVSNGGIFKETSSIKQRGVMFGCGFDRLMSEHVMLTLAPEFVMLSSGDQAKTESYSYPDPNIGFKSRVDFKADEVGLKQETPVYRFNINTGVKFSFRRCDLSLMYRLMLLKPFYYDKAVWYEYNDAGTTQKGSNTFTYKAKLNGLSLQFRYFFLDWH